jgi:hypothetical protein
MIKCLDFFEDHIWLGCVIDRGSLKSIIFGLFLTSVEAKTPYSKNNFLKIWDNQSEENSKF